MRQRLGVLALGTMTWLLAVSADWAGETRRPANVDAQMAASAALRQTDLYNDPYRRYFSGHWCDCWRRSNVLPVDEKAMFAGILPRTDTPPWMKHVLLDMKGMTPDEKLLCRAAAGLVNRVKGQWYCIEEDDFWQKGLRQFFKDGITGPPIKGLWVNSFLGPQEIGFTCHKEGENNFLVAIKRYSLEFEPPSVDGCVIYDPALLDPNARPRQPRDLLNVIRTMCALERALPLTPKLYQDLVKLMGDRNRLPVVMDTTKWHDFDIEKFHGDEKAAAYALYAWAFNNFWKNDKNPKRQCTHHVLCYMPPLGPSPDPEQDLSDYVIKWGVFCFYSYGGDKLDEKHMEYVLTQAPMNIPVIGQLTTKTGAEAEAERTRALRLFSRFGKYFVDTRMADNLTVHSGERQKERFAFRQKPAPAVARDPAKNYIAFCLTGGNSLGHFMTARARHWDFVSRGSVALGWGIPPAAADVLPNIAKYYYREASPNDCFVADLGGLGQAYPTVWGAGSNQPADLLAGYFQRSKEYLGYLDLSTAWMDWLDEKSLDSLVKNIAGLQAVFYGTRGANRRLERAGFMQGNMPVFFTYSDLVANSADLERLPATLQQAKERFFFIGVDETAFGPDEDVVAAIRKTALKLGERFVAVRPDQLATLFAEAVKARQVPAEPPNLSQSYGVADRQNLTLKRVADGSIRVDGNVSDWSQVQALQAYVTRDGRTVTGAKPADGDLAAEVSAVVDSRFLYVLARVRDAEVIVDDVDLTAGDHVEVFLDTRRAPFREAQMTEGFYRLALVPAAGLVKKPQLVLQYPPYDVGLVSLNKHGVQEELSSVVSGDGYLIEAAIPLLNFAGCAWKPGDQLAIGFAVRTLDGRTATTTRAAPMMVAVDPLSCRPVIVN